jgi:hypothetical protein
LQSFTETDPTVPAWAKAASKPTYTKSEVGLGNADNTSDANKPVSAAQQTALDKKADKALTGLSTAASAAVTETDSVLTGIGKLQAQVNGLSSGSSGAIEISSY